MLGFPIDNLLLWRCGCDTDILEFIDFKLGVAYLSVCRVGRLS